MSALLLLIVVIAACKYNDGELWDKVNSLDNRLTSVEDQLSQMNSDISSISIVVNALQNNIYVTNISKIQNGYRINFSDGKSITIANGKNGTDAPIWKVYIP